MSRILLGEDEYNVRVLLEQVCAAAGGYGERVEDPAALPGALQRALKAVTVEKRQALLNVICRGP